jgi:hypothetical protein
MESVTLIKQQTWSQLHSIKQQTVGDSHHIMIIVLMRVSHFIYTMYNIYTMYTHSLTACLTETLLVKSQSQSHITTDI